MHDLEQLATAETLGASRDLRAMQALGRSIVDAGGADARLRPLARALARDLDAALAGKAAPWSEARTRFEARKLARLVPSVTDGNRHDVDHAPEAAHPCIPEHAPEDGKHQVLTRLAIALVAAALWAIWLVSLQGSGPIAWDGGTGPAQTQNLFTLYAPAVLALLATLMAVDSLGTSPSKAPNASD